MCGICGFVGIGDRSLLFAMNELMAHRGPDGGGLWLAPAGDAGLAMKRLAIIDPTGGNQPMLSPEGDLAVVFNGEIYNYRELRAELAAKGHLFATNSDTEVLLAGFREYGEAIPAKLRGMFAFAIWDQKRKTLFAARDRLGIKPFYYCRCNGSFFFASEQKPLIRAMGNTPQANRPALMRHLLLGFYTGPHSIFQGIEQLPPASNLTWNEGILRQQTYWRLPECADREPSESFREELRERIRDAVKSHLVSDVPVGLTLSGGLDSSVLALLMAREANGNGKVHSFTVGYGAPSDETPFARKISQSLGLASHYRTIPPSEALELLPAIVWTLEEPLSNVTALTSYLWSRLASEYLKVVLVGEGADEILAGYFQYRLFAGKMRALPQLAAARLFRLACLQPPLTLLQRLFGQSRECMGELRGILHDEFLLPLAGHGGGVKGALGFDLAFELSNNQLQRVDRTSMAFSLEARVPYLDHHLVEFAWRLPIENKIGPLGQKLLLRQTFAGAVAPEILARPKIGPGGSQALLPILYQAGLEEVVRKVLGNPREIALAWFDHGVIRNLIERKAGVYPVLGARIRDKLLYALLLWVIWHRLFIEGATSLGSPAPTMAEMFASH